MLVTGSSYSIVSIIVILQHRHLHQSEVAETKRHIYTNYCVQYTGVSAPSRMTSPLVKHEQTMPRSDTERLSPQLRDNDRPPAADQLRQRSAAVSASAAS